MIPAHFNDRLLLGLKGTMSEAELHVLKARLARRHPESCPTRRAQADGARSASSMMRSDRVILDPDAQVQSGGASVLRNLQAHGLLFGGGQGVPCERAALPAPAYEAAPTRVKLVWAELLHCRARQIIHNPRYTGAFVFGRTKQRHLPNGKYSSRQVPSEEWILLRDMHPGYITWEEYQSNLAAREGQCARLEHGAAPRSRP